MSAPPRDAASSALALVAGVALGPIAACTDDGPEEGEARLEVDGTALVERQDGERETVTDDSADIGTRRPGHPERGHRAPVACRGDTVLELRAGDDGRRRHGASSWAPSPCSRPGTCSSARPRASRCPRPRPASPSTAARRGFAALLTSRWPPTTPTCTLDSAGQERDIPALREMQVPALGLPPEAPRPLALRRRRRVGPALPRRGHRPRRAPRVAGRRLHAEPRRRRRPARRASTSRCCLASPTRWSSRSTSSTADRAPGETLVGAAIADLGRRGTFARAVGVGLRLPRRGRGLGPGRPRPGRGPRPAAGLRHRRGRVVARSPSDPTRPRRHAAPRPRAPCRPPRCRRRPPPDRRRRPPPPCRPPAGRTTDRVVCSVRCSDRSSIP